VNRRIIAVALLIFAIVGCATRPLSNGEAIPVRADQIIDSKYLEAAPGTGTVVVKRDRGFLGSACSSRVFVDANPVADLRPSQKVLMHLPAGDHVIAAWPNGICGGGMSEVRATVTTGVELTFRIGYGSNGDFTINPTAF
jgi:hypothetical protein